MAKEWPLVSVVIPVYNGETYIEDCLRSILAQDYPALEVIVVDDGSTDSTERRVRGFGDAVTYHRQPNSGSAVARNLGVSLARGDYIGFCDGDDLWAPHRLRQQVDFLAAQHEYHAVCGRFIPVPEAYTLADAAREAYRAEATLDPTMSGWAYLPLLESSIYHLDALLVRREVLQRVRFNPDYRRGQDFDFFLQLANATPIAQLDNLYAFYRQSPGSITRKPHARNYRAEITTAAVARYGHKDQLGREISRAQLDALLARSWFSHGWELFTARWFRAAVTSFRRCLSHDPRHWAAYRFLVRAWLMRLGDRTPKHALGK